MIGLVLVALLCGACATYGESAQHPFGQSLAAGERGSTVTAHPALAHLLVSFSSGEHTNTSECDGTIISEIYILTAGHCLKHPNPKIVIIVATTDISNNKGRRYIAKNHHIHPKYLLVKEEALAFDAGLVESSTTMKLDALAAPARLAKHGTVLKEKQNVTVVGWGGNPQSDVPYVISHSLHEVTLFVLKDRTCKFVFGGTHVTDQTFCAGYISPGAGTCYGDTGGPAITNDRVQVGIVLVGPGCGGARAPSAFAHVKDLRDWINQIAKV